jgi:hypothetical protein
MRYPPASVRWTVTFVYLGLVAITVVALNLMFDWSDWLLAVLILLLFPAAVGLAVTFRNTVNWSMVLSYLSALSLLAALVTQLGGWPVAARDWFLMIWSVLLLGLAISLFTHPMRKPALGLFIGFWGVVGVLWLIVVQALVMVGILEGGAYVAWASWPIGFIGLWFIVASATGYGASPFGPIVDSLGILTGALFIGISVAAWTGQADLRLTMTVVAAAAYVLWIAGLGVAFMRLERPTPTGHLVRISLPV